MKYHEVLDIQKKLESTIEATVKAEGDSSNVNSIVKLLALNSPAKIPDLENGKEGLALEVMQAELRNMRQMMEMYIFESRKNLKRESISAIKYQRLSANLDKLINSKRVPIEERMDRYHLLMREVEELMHTCRGESEHLHFRRLMERVHRAECEIIA